MSDTPIEDHWQRVIEDTKFCCDAHQEEAKTMFFTGAMAALHALTGWDPAVPELVTVDADQTAAVAGELTTAFHAIEAGDGNQAVRH